jgi:hypothetical protein
VGCKLPDIFKNRILRQVPLNLGISVALLAFIVSWIRGIEKSFIPDSGGYLLQSKKFLLGWEYIFNNPQDFTHGIGFSGFISLTFLVTGTQSLILFKAILAVSHGVSAWLVYKIADNIGLYRKFSLFAATLYSIDPFVLSAVGDIQTESFTALLALYWCYVYLNSGRTLSRQHYLLVPISGVFSILIRPNSLLVVILVLGLILTKIHKDSIIKSAYFIGIAMSSLLLIIYEVFISVLYKGFVFLSPIGGVSTAYMCREEFLPQYFGVANRNLNAEINQFAQGGGGISEIIKNSSSLSLSELNNVLFEIGKASCLEDPIKSFGILIIKLFAIWRPFTVFGAYPLSIFVLSLSIWVPLLITMILFLKKKSSRVCENFKLYFILLSAGYTISLLLTPTQVRHRIAFAEAFLWIMMAWYMQKKSRSSISRRVNHD